MVSLNPFPGSEASGAEDFSLLSGEIVAVRKYSTTFRQWAGAPPANTYGNKAVLDWNGEPVFAELAILRSLEQEGWAGVWADSFSRQLRIGLLDVPPVELPDELAKLYESIKQHSQAKHGGCWDVFAWHGDDVLFAELKRKGRDSIRDSQRAWLEAALAVGVTLDSFVVVEWRVTA
jgi:hypothetical protein